MHPFTSRLRRAAAVIATAALALTFSASAAQAAPEGNKAYSGYSHDIKTYVAGVVTSGPVVAAGVGCSDKAPLFYQNQATDLVSLAGITIPATGLDLTRSEASKSGSVQTNKSTYQVEDIGFNLGLNFKLEADSIILTNTTTYNTSTGAFTRTSAMTVANLKVGLPLVPPIISITGTVTPNTGLAIPGVGTLGLHMTQDVGDGVNSGGRLATAIKLDLLGGTAGTAVGETFTSIWGEADQNWMFGAGEGLTVSTSDLGLKVGPLVQASLPCTGTGGDLVNAAGTNGLPALLGSLAAIQSTATGTRSGPNASGTTTSQVAGVNLLGGLVQADAVGSSSNATTSNNGATVSTSASTTTLTNLVVAGIPVNANAAPNTQITLPGVGYVVLNARNTFAFGIEIVPVRVVLLAGNTLGLPTATIDVARSWVVLLGASTGDAAMMKAQTFLKKNQSAEQRSELSQDLVTDGTLKKNKVLPDFKQKMKITKFIKVTTKATESKNG